MVWLILAPFAGCVYLVVLIVVAELRWRAAEQRKHREWIARMDAMIEAEIEDKWRMKR